MKPLDSLSYATANPANTQTLPVDGPLGFNQLEAVAHGQALALTDSHWQAVDRCRALVENLMQQRRRIYGVTTGYGPLANTYVDDSASDQLQRGLVYHLSAGTGPTLPATSVRAIMAARVGALAQGHSGVRASTLQRVLDALTEDCIPVVPALGTVGASGDLTPLAHITLALMGEGKVDLKGQRMSAAEALNRLGWSPLTPQDKDALALVNGTSAMTGLAALGAPRARRCVQLSALTTLLYGEALSYQQEALAQGLAQIRPHAGQAWAQSALAHAARDSQRLQPYTGQPPVLPASIGEQTTLLDQELPQAPYTFRCAQQHLGAVVDTLRFHEQTVHNELHAVTDNPVFMPDTGDVIHGGNFFGQHLALSSDAANNALLTLAIHAERRIARITDVSQNLGLPPFLRGNNNGLHSGFMGAQVTATALVAELRTHAHPASIQSIPTNGNNQDVVTLGTIAARRTLETLDRLQELLAIECLVMVQAAELRDDRSSFSSASQALMDWVRRHADPLTDDRPLHVDITQVTSAIRVPEAMSDWLDALIPVWE